MSVQQHYDNHLGHFYSWMLGDFETKAKEAEALFHQWGIKPHQSGTALELGAGNGIHTVALCRLAFHVTAIDFSLPLLEELKHHTQGMQVEVIQADMREAKKYVKGHPELIICCGDTLTHLNDKAEASSLLTDLCHLLERGGQLLLTFRDYSQTPDGNRLIIPVKSDENRILTCIMDYFPEHVLVTDLLHEKTTKGWEQKVSTYSKVRLKPDWVIQQLEKCGMNINLNQVINRMNTVLVTKN